LAPVSRDDRARREEQSATLIAFDVLFAAGEDVRMLPLEGRKDRLARLVPNTPHLRAMLPVEQEGEWLFAQAQSMRLEGIVAKRLGSRYRRGRTADWLKIKTEHARAESGVASAGSHGLPM
jgi:bifunctional non-homologous end joining protein LigD